MNQPASGVTVIIPTRNRCHLLATTLRSALAQSGVDLAVVVVDDASDDATSELLASCADPRLRVIRNPDPLSAPAARNRGLEVVDTPWVAFLDDDDIWAPNKLRAQLDALEQGTEAAWSATGAVQFIVRNGRPVLVGGRRPPPNGDAFPSLLGSNVIPGGGSSVMASSDLVRSLGGFRPFLAEDWDLWLRLAKQSPLAVVDEPLVASRLTDTSRSFDPRRVRPEHDQMREEFANERRMLSVPDSEVEIRRYELQQVIRLHQRVPAARLLASLALRERKLGSLALAVAALVSPKLVGRIREHRALSGVGSSWANQVSLWLPDAILEEGTRPSDVIGRATLLA
jgi:glycosyltransferase involved in cell wall biosynthesis